MKCVLHIGTEKTGTTLIQNWLYENQRPLSEQGIALTTVADKTNNRKLVSFCQSELDDYTRAYNITTKEEKAQYFAGFEAALFAEIDQLARSHDVVVFTSEHFHSRLRSPGEVRAVKELLSKRFDDIKVICYFREQSQTRTSLYSTGLKIAQTCSIEDYQRHISTGDDYYNYFQFFKKWESVFGRDSLIPRIYDRNALLDNDLRLDFMAAALPHVDTTRLTYNTNTANRSITRRQAFFYRVVNKAVPRFTQRFLNPLVGAFKRRINEIEILREGGRIYDPHQREMYERFEASNLDFFERYFGRRENLFQAPEVAGGTNALDLSDEELGDVLAEMLNVEGLTLLLPKEISLLRDVAVRLHREGHLTRAEATVLLKVAQRARPDGKRIRNMLAKVVDEPFVDARK